MVSFTTIARLVRDERLRLGWRHKNLVRAVGEYHPLGFSATRAYVETVAASRDLALDGAALLRAIDALQASHAVWRAEMEAFVATRKREKASGRRLPPPSTRVLLLRSPRWPSRTTPSRPGLVAAVQAGYVPLHPWSRSIVSALEADYLARFEPVHAVIRQCVDEYLTGSGRLDPAAHHVLDSAIHGLYESVGPDQPRLHTLRWIHFAELLAYAARLPPASV